MTTMNADRLRIECVMEYILLDLLRSYRQGIDLGQVYRLVEQGSPAARVLDGSRPRRWDGLFESEEEGRELARHGPRAVADERRHRAALEEPAPVRRQAF